MQRIRLLVLVFTLALGAVPAACAEVRGNEPATTLPPVSALVTRAAETSQQQDSGLITRDPATKRPVTPTRPASINGFRKIGIDQLPPEARGTLDLIARGGPFPYRQDGQIFQNRERLLPDKPRGYYHEYTVETPGSDDRGARRIITGEEGELYYTEDHYSSFMVIVNNE
jgi:ribonuclease T1